VPALGERIADGLVVVKDGYLADTTRVRLVEAGHPVPDARGEAAARRIRGIAESAGADDLLLVLVSGGGSALTPAPVPPITLADKQAMTRLLLAAGANINQLNAVRKHCSLLKGGQLARAAAPARVHALLLSDVIGDPLDVIASGPTAPDASTDRGLELILWDLAQNSFLAESSRLAASVQRELNALTGTRDRGVRQAPFRVLMGATMPAILVEAGFISNPDEEARFKDDAYKDKVVEAIARAVSTITAKP